MQFWTLIIDSFRESMDRKIFWVITAITVLVLLTMVTIGFEADHVSLLYAIRRDPTCRQPGLADSSSCSLEKVSTDHMANLVRSMSFRT